MCPQKGRDKDKCSIMRILRITYYFFLRTNSFPSTKFVDCFLLFIINRNCFPAFIEKNQNKKDKNAHQLEVNKRNGEPLGAGDTFLLCP